MNISKVQLPHPPSIDKEMNINVNYVRDTNELNMYATFGMKYTYSSDDDECLSDSIMNVREKLFYTIITHNR